MSRIDLALTLLAASNLAAFCAFALDKRRAKVGDWRIPEQTLLFWTLLGGLGGWMGQHMLRHKTRKEPFRTRMGVVLAVHAAGAIGLFWWLLT